jgi:hypothetical protein
MILKLDAESKSKLNAGGGFSYLFPYRAASVTIRGWREKALRHTSLTPRRGGSQGKPSISLIIISHLRYCGLRRVGFSKRIAVINDHNHVDSSDFTEFTRREHRDANAPVTGWAGGN